MITCKYLGDKTFATKAELFKALKENKADIIAIKKMANKECDGYYTPHTTTKAATTNNSNATELEVDVVGNTYLWLDSHSDAHIPPIFTKSVKENQKNIMHLHDHVDMVTAKVGIPSLVYETNMPWRDLGVDKDGTTVVLAMKSKVMDVLNKSVFYQYKNGLIQQHSVSMQYIDLAMCVDSEEEQYKEEYANWLKYYPMLGNQDKAKEQGYFFAVTQAKLKEISAVTKGSNELTPTMKLDTTIEPQSTQTKSFLEQIRETNFINI